MRFCDIFLTMNYGNKMEQKTTDGRSNPMKLQKTIMRYKTIQDDTK